jgi:N-acetylneuraminic acid mutarotase
VSAACSAPTKKNVDRCFALRVDTLTTVKGVKTRTAVKGLVATTAPAGLAPSDLVSAYQVPANGGAGATIAIVDAYDDPTAASDLALYRQQYGLPALKDGQFLKVNQRGRRDHLPIPDEGWAAEISLDLDMVSAVAPQANIILVEADTASSADLGPSVNEAVALGAGYVSNSYGSGYTSVPGSGESSGDIQTSQAYYDHPGVAIVAATGDESYGVSFPASSPHVTSVGGTSLVKDASTPRGWSETVWNSRGHGPGSGCSIVQPKPAFQHDTGCAGRTLADVSAVGDPLTGVAVYDSYGSTGNGWAVYGGTSVATPIITSTYADAGPVAPSSYPNSYPYAHTDAINDVTSGTNGTCTPAYLCTAGPGFDGPTGLGTPNGTTAFAAGSMGTLSGTVTDAAGQPVADAKVSASGASNASMLTGSDGTFSMPVIPGSYQLSASEFAYNTVTQNTVTVTANATTTQAFSLTRQPEVTVSGKVADASGHGWPMYASIQVDNGIPGSPFPTDPKTGAYSIQLPENGAYTLHTTSNYTGYAEQDVAVTTQGTDKVQNIGLTADTLAAVGQPEGYTQHSSGTTETFTANTAPAGWSVQAATGPAWQFNPNYINMANPTGGFAAVVTNWAPTDTTLVTPVATVPAGQTPFVSYLSNGSGGTAEVDYSIDGGKTWTVGSTEIASQAIGSQVLTGPVTGRPEAWQVRFRYTANTATTTIGSDWELADVLTGGSWVTPQPGGLIVGNIKDRNTAATLDTATVAVDGLPAQSATSAPMPGVADRSDGFYYFFSSAIGKHAVTASMYQYKTTSEQVTLAADQTNLVDFALPTGRLVTSGAVSGTVPWRGSGSQNLTLGNTGDAPVTVKLDQFTGTAGASGPGWTTTADLPATGEALVAGSHNGLIYAGLGDDVAAGTLNTFYSYNPATNAWAQKASAPYSATGASGAFIGDEFYAEGGISMSADYEFSMESTTQIYDPATDTWSKGAQNPHPTSGGGTAVLGGKLYIVGGGTLDTSAFNTVSVYDPATDKWSTTTPYPERIADESCGTIGDKIYCAGGIGDAGTLTDAFVFNPADSTWKPIAKLPISLAAAAYSTANGQLLVSGGFSGADASLTTRGFAYDPAMNWWTPLPDAPTDHFWATGVLGYYTIGGTKDVFSGRDLTTVSHLTGYDQAGAVRLPWVSADRSQVTIQPGQHVTLRIRLDARASGLTQPGTDTGFIGFETDSAYTVGAVPVSMTVSAPNDNQQN